MLAVETYSIGCIHHDRLAPDATYSEEDFSMKKLIYASALAFALIATPALAQDSAAEVVQNADSTYEVQRPAGWESADGNDRAEFNFVHTDTSAQIEVIKTQLLTPDVAEVFFDTFHDTLTNASFNQVSQEDGVTLGDHEGTRTVYSFEHSGTELNVHIFQFTTENNAWLVVGYMGAADSEALGPDFEAVVTSLSAAE